MPVTQLHGLEAIKVDVDDATTTVLSGIIDSRIALTNDLGNVITDGDVYPRFNSLVNQKVGGTFGCLHISQALMVCGLPGLRISATGGTKTGLTLYAKKQAEGGARAAGNTHDSYTIKEGLLVPRRLIAEHGQHARIEYELFATWDGTNKPVVAATGQALPTNPNDPERFSLGPISLGIEEVGASFTQCRSLEIEFGAVAGTEGADGDVWDTFARYQEAMPRITLRGVNKNWLNDSNVPLAGADITHTGTEILLLRRKQGGTFYPGDEEEHILITCAGMAVHETPWDVRGNAPGETTLVITLRHDGTNNPIVVDPAYAYEEELT